MPYLWQQGDQEGSRGDLRRLRPHPEVSVAQEGERGGLPTEGEKGPLQETPPACLRTTHL